MSAGSPVKTCSCSSGEQTLPGRPECPQEAPQCPQTKFKMFHRKPHGRPVAPCYLCVCNLANGAISMCHSRGKDRTVYIAPPFLLLIDADTLSYDMDWWLDWIWKQWKGKNVGLRIYYCICWSPKCTEMSLCNLNSPNVVFLWHTHAFKSCQVIFELWHPLPWCLRR